MNCYRKCSCIVSYIGTSTAILFERIRQLYGDQMTIARRSDAAAPAGDSTTPPASPDQLLTAPQLEHSDSDSAARRPRHLSSTAVPLRLVLRGCVGKCGTKCSCLAPSHLRRAQTIVGLETASSVPHNRAHEMYLVGDNVKHLFIVHTQSLYFGALPTGHRVANVHHCATHCMPDH